MSPGLQPLPRVLYVEDNQQNVALMQRLFQERPALELLIANDGATGRQLALSKMPQLVLTDLNLPDMSGEELVRLLRIELKDSMPPIVVLSADATSATIDRLRSLGIAQYLTKPYALHSLYGVIDMYCSQRNAS